MTAVASETQPFEPIALQRLLDGHYAPLRERIRETLCRPEFAPVIAIPTAEYREKVLQWARILAGKGMTAPGFPANCGGEAKGFYLEHGRLAPPRCKSITREVNRLCNEARQHCGRFVDAFGIPDQILAAPIPTGQGEASADA